MEQKQKKFIRNFIIQVVVLLLGIGAVVVVIDPFFHYHEPVGSLKAIVTKAEYQCIGTVHNFEYDGIVLGSSVAENYNNRWFDEAFGGTTIKGIKSSAATVDLVYYLEEALASNEVKNVYYSMDIFALTEVAKKELPVASLPLFLYNENPFDDVQYIWNKDVLLNYILRPLVDTKDKSDWNMIYKPWWQDEHYQKALVLMFYEPAPESDVYVEPDTYTNAIEANLNTNIIPYIEEHPETTFHIFYPPYSILYWYDVVRGQELDAVIEKYRYMTTRLLEYDNVEIYFFQNQEDIICNLNNYADYTHYHGSICNYMVQCFANGKRRVTEDTLEKELSVLRELTENYDYEAIWDDWYN